MKTQSLLFTALMTSFTCAQAQDNVQIKLPIAPGASVAPTTSKPKTTLLLLKDSEGSEKVSKKTSAVAIPSPAETASNYSEEVVDLPLPKPGTKFKAEAMPGIGTMPGEFDSKPKTIKIGTDRNELVYVGMGQTNRISTPFDDPQVIDSSGATLKAVGQDIYFVPSSNKPTTIYITGGSAGQTVGLTVVPKNVPAQTIVLQLSTPTSVVNGMAGSGNDEYAATDYSGKINQIIKQLCLDKVPAGFIKAEPPKSIAGNSTLQIIPTHKYSGQSYDIYRYKIQSSSASPIELKEEAFYNESVRAVAFYPNTVLQNGEATEAFIITDRPLRK